MKRRYSAEETSAPAPAPLASATPGATIHSTPAPVTPTIRAPMAAVAAKSHRGTAAPATAAATARGLKPPVNQKSPRESSPSTSARVSRFRLRTTK